MQGLEGGRGGPFPWPLVALKAAAAAAALGGGGGRRRAVTPIRSEAEAAEAEKEEKRVSGEKKRKDGGGGRRRKRPPNEILRPSSPSFGRKSLATSSLGLSPAAAALKKEDIFLELFGLNKDPYSRRENNRKRVSEDGEEEEKEGMNSSCFCRPVMKWK